MRGLILAAFLLLQCGVVDAAGVVDDTQAASVSSVRKLLASMRSEDLVESAIHQMDEDLRTTMDKAAPSTISLDQRAVLDDVRHQMVELMREDLRWSELEPDIASVYVHTFTEGEVQGLLDFYRSPVGQAFVNKMPAAMQLTMQLINRKVVAMQPKLEALQRKAAAEIKDSQQR